MEKHTCILFVNFLSTMKQVGGDFVIIDLL